MKNYSKPEAEVVEFLFESITSASIGDTEGEETPDL